MNDLVPQDHFKDPMAGLTDGLDSDAKIPFYKIEYMAGGDTPDSFEEGLFTRGKDAQSEKINCSLLRSIYIGNEMYPEVYKAKEDPLCYSGPGGVQPVGGTAMQDVKTCLECGMATWPWVNKKNVGVTDDKLKVKKPPCCAVQSLLAYDWDNATEFEFRVKRSAREEYFKPFVDTVGLEYKNLDSDARFQGFQAPWHFKVEITTERHPRFKKAHMPIFKIVGRTTKEEAEMLAGVWQSLEQQFSKTPMLQEPEEISGSDGSDIPDCLKDF